MFLTLKKKEIGNNYDKYCVANARYLICDFMTFLHFFVNLNFSRLLFFVVKESSGEFRAIIFTFFLNVFYFTGRVPYDP